MIISQQLQLKGETEPHRHIALVFPDACGPEDLIAYRDAVTTAVKVILTSENVPGNLSDDCFFLLRLAEFIDDSIDAELSRAKETIYSLRKAFKEAEKKGV